MPDLLCARKWAKEECFEAYRLEGRDDHLER